jgi:hypothetical protein
MDGRLLGEESKKNKTITKIDDKRKLKKATVEPVDFFAFLQKHNSRLFAHHPDHPAFQDHFWISRGLYFCKGCIMTFAGMICGYLLYWLMGWLRWFSDVQIGCIFLGLLLPSVVTSLLDLPRLVKHISPDSSWESWSPPRLSCSS